MSNKITHSLVLDQSTTTVGWAVINDDPDAQMGYGINGKLFEHGVITTPSKLDAFGRITIIEEDLVAILRKFSLIEEIIVEDLMNISQMTGATQQALAWVLYVIKKITVDRGLKLFKQNPTTVKKLCALNGKADKEEMKQAAMASWNLKSVIDDNHADALCGAYAWLFQGDEKRLPKVKKLKKKKAGK
jgi:Holliday junction resolvasome RuvABC endonuclease subunit